VKIALLSCTARKRNESCTASEMYEPSTFFKAQKAYAEKYCDTYLILSAEHGVLTPRQVIQPYNKTLKSMPKSERQAWAKKVKLQLEQYNNINTDFVILAGQSYKEFIIDWLRASYKISEPLVGKGGIGSQVSWLQKA